MKYVPLAAVLLLGGCLEAADAVGGAITRAHRYCTVPNGVVLCDQPVAAAPAAATVVAAPAVVKR